MTTIWRRYEAQAAHFLPEVRDGHKCKKVHGHNFRVTVYVTREITVDGMVLDFEVLDAIWNERIKPHFDHDLVNEWVKNPTSEELAKRIHAEFCIALPEDAPPVEPDAGIGYFDIVIEVEENDRSGARYP